MGILREEVWQDANGTIVKYNLAFINHEMCQVDDGRVLGYDNAHGENEKHFNGTVKPHPYSTYETSTAQFFHEVETLRRSKQ